MGNHEKLESRIYWKKENHMDFEQISFNPILGELSKLVNIGMRASCGDCTTGCGGDKSGSCGECNSDGCGGAD